MKLVELIYSVIRGDKKRIKLFLSEIEELRGLDKQKASLKIASAIKKLNNISIHEIDLSHCCLKKTNLFNLLKSS